MFAFVLFGTILNLNLVYEGLRADSKIMSFLGNFCAGMCAMCVIIGLGYMIGAI